MVEKSQAEALLARLQTSPAKGEALRQTAMELLDELESYSWSGVYRLHGDTLVLDAYVGAPTDHTHIPVGRGVCGTAVAENANQVIDDVRELTNYLSCSLQTRSEIVVLVKRDETILGQIDIDGHKVAAFDASDEELLTRMATVLAEHWDG